MTYVSYICISIILLAAFGAYHYINSQKEKDNLLKKRAWIETLPNVISTLGVLGTFFGISLGLYYFDTKDLGTSIPQLLAGLKTAFGTSLAGMIGSLILTKKVNNIYEEITGGTSDINQAANLICKAVSDLQGASSQQANSQTVFYNLMQTLVQNMDANIKSIDANLNNINIAANNIALTTQGLVTTSAATAQDTQKIVALATGIGTTVSDIQSSTTSIVTSVGNIEGSTNDINANTANTTNIATGIGATLSNIDGATTSIIASVGNIEEASNNQIATTNAQTEIIKEANTQLGNILDIDEAMVSTEAEVAAKIQDLTNKLHGEVVEIEDKMSETNGLLAQKFDEFSELLKKNNTEALVEVMKRVTEEFQKQMNSLISKLIQENFDQLNQSVEKLNLWQQENKEMIKSLTSQYQQMATNFENTSTSLNKVKEDTKSLVSEGGKLDTLVNSLNDVIVKDEKFKEISNNLQKTADLSKSNMENFDNSTRQLNDWVKKQRNFTDSVTLLIQKLEEINEIRNYADTFWKDTKNGMNEAVGIIKNGSENLNKQLTGLDQQFYARLSTTLAQLDACIQALITNSEKRN